MRLLDRLGVAQRIILTVTLGLALGAIGTYIMRLGHEGTWFGFAPGTGNVSLGPSVSDLSPWEELLVWLGLILAWSALSLVIWRPVRTPVAQGDRQPDT
jgi:hypothetical protein